MPVHSRGMAERQCVRQLASDSGEGQDTVFHDRCRRDVYGAGQPSNQTQGLPPFRPSTFGCGLDHRHVGVRWVLFGLIGNGSS